MTQFAEEETQARVGVALRALAAVLIPYAFVLSHRNTPLIVAIIGLSALVALPRLRVAPVGAALLGLIAWAAATMLWSPYEDRWSWIDNFILLAVCSSALFVIRPSRSVTWLFWGLVAGWVLLLIEAISGGIIRDLTPPLDRPDLDNVSTARGITCMMILMPPLVLWAWQRHGRTAAAALAIGAVFMGSKFGVSVNLLAAVAGILVAVVAFRWSRAMLHVVFWGMMLAFLAMPMIATALPPVDVMVQWEVGPASWRMRLVAWKEVWLAVERADAMQVLFGHGVEAARILGEELGPSRIKWTEGHNVIPLHPHNVFIQIWYDLGLAGVWMSVTASWLGLRQLLRSRLAPEIVAAICALAVIAGIVAAVDASIWSIWRVVCPIWAAFLLHQLHKRA